jgi:hypothetical protein
MRLSSLSFDWRVSLAPAVLALVVVAAAPLGACGSSGNGSKPAADSGAAEDASEGGEEDGGEGGAVTYPAFPVDTPQIAKNQGAVLTSPVIVTVSWPGDTSASTWEAFDDGIGATSYWSATTSQYGVGAAVGGPSNHVRMTQPLASSLSYTDVQTFVVNTLTGGGAGGGDAGAADAGPPNPAWPAPTKDAKGNVQTIYALYIPASTTVTDPGSGASFCDEGALGYHDSVTVGGSQVAYAVSLECPKLPLSEVEETAAHELIEASTDPYTESSTLGYVGFDPDHVAWDLYTGYNDELADACENWQDSYYQETGSFPYWVQRSWSNEAAPLGHSPCAPAPAGPYKGITIFPSAESTVKVNLTSVGGSSASPSKGFKATLNQPLTFQVGFFSDAPTSEPWTIDYDFPATLQTMDFTTGNPLDNGAGTVKFDKTSGQNGDKANVTVTVTRAAPTGFHVIAITWNPPTGAQAALYVPHYLPILVVDE